MLFLNRVNDLPSKLCIHPIDKSESVSWCKKLWFDLKSWLDDDNSAKLCRIKKHCDLENGTCKNLSQIILPLLMNWENWWGKKGWDLWKIEVGLQKLRRKPKFFRPYLNYPKVKAFFSSSVFPIHQQRKNFCLVMDPF